MELKGTQAVNVYLNNAGYICIEQNSTEFGKIVEVQLTPDQFGIIENWAFKNKESIELSWNDGVGDDTES